MIPSITRERAKQKLRQKSRMPLTLLLVHAAELIERRRRIPRSTGLPFKVHRTLRCAFLHVPGNRIVEVRDAGKMESCVDVGERWEIVFIYFRKMRTGKLPVLVSFTSSSLVPQYNTLCRPDIKDLTSPCSISHLLSSLSMLHLSLRPCNFPCSTRLSALPVPFLTSWSQTVAEPLLPPPSALGIGVIWPLRKWRREWIARLWESMF